MAWARAALLMGHKTPVSFHADHRNPAYMFQVDEEVPYGESIAVMDRHDANNDWLRPTLGWRSAPQLARAGCASMLNGRLTYKLRYAAAACDVSPDVW